MIVKCGDDLRQELLAYQLLLQFQVSSMVCMAGLFFTSGAFNSEIFMVVTSNRGNKYGELANHTQVSFLVAYSKPPFTR